VSASRSAEERLPSCPAHAQALVAAVQGGSLLAAVAGGPAPLQAVLDRALEALLRS
jgi:hypothetical protein